MSKYIMNINGKIGLSDYSSIDDYVSIVNKNDNLIININKSEEEDINMICRILEKNNFCVDLNENLKEHQYWINASRDK